MKLIIGGAFSGKEIYAEDHLSVLPIDCTPEEALKAPAISNLQNILRTLLERDENTDTFIEQLIEQNPNAVVICDEIGMGVVPLDPLERQWREATGRACCALAKSAETVIRVVCGIPVILKG
ncbi:MAG: adenosylcobinamide kinase [Clostridiaceae bacterium]|jgi:adenosylcobinamide kinase/adenosylcobinamide-phosphate guanylyltransferase|nr:adenosylcobinamide kinase [Clostridiaceae bacterium]